jgi:hypothetical protein
MSNDLRITDDAADFYLGRGGQARYLGTLARAGAPEDIEIWERFQSLDDEPVTDDAFRHEVEQLAEFTTWPWLHHHDSVDTPWAYMFDRGTLYVYRYGVEMARIVANYTVPTSRGIEPRQPRQANRNQFPIVAPRQAAP